MKTANEILADHLRSSLTEACCGKCGLLAKLTGKHVCCADEKQHEAKGSLPDDWYGTEPPKGQWTAKLTIKGPPQSGRVDYFLFTPQGGGSGSSDSTSVKVIMKRLQRTLLHNKVQDVNVWIGNEKSGKVQRKLVAVSQLAESIDEAERETTHPFIKRCVAAITDPKTGSKDANDPAQLSSAFAICTSQKKRAPEAAREKKKEGVPESRMKQYEKALSQARAARRDARRDEATEMSLFDRIIRGRGQVQETATMDPDSAWAMAQLKKTGHLPSGYQMVFGTPRKTGDARPAAAPAPEKKPAPEKPEGAKTAAAKPPKSKMAEVGDGIRDKSEINVGGTSVGDMMKFVDKKFAEAGTTAEKAFPGFEENLAVLKKKMSFAKDIKRIDMPVVEPKDMDKFKADLEKGAVDIFAPFAKETIKKYGTPFPWERGKTPVEPGSPEAKKLIGLGLPKKDKGPPGDDIVKAKLDHTKVTELKPLQNEIWLTKVVGNMMAFGKPEQGGKLTDDAPIIVSSDGYILDGHHRFGQAMLADPSLKLKTLTIPLDIDRLLKLGRTYGTAIGNKAKA